jgi:hypothetical protein
LRRCRTPSRPIRNRCSLGARLCRNAAAFDRNSPDKTIVSRRIARQKGRSYLTLTIQQNIRAGYALCRMRSAFRHPSQRFSLVVREFYDIFFRPHFLTRPLLLWMSLLYHKFYMTQDTLLFHGTFSAVIT